MSLSSRSKLGSFRPWLVVAAALTCAGAISVGCVIVDDSSVGSGPPPPATLPPSSQPANAAIDTDATISVTPGDGVGVFVQYAAGGHWTVSTACDTNTSQLACGFDVFVSTLDPTTKLSNPQGQNLDGSDLIETQRDGTLHLIATTSTGLDGITFDGPAGAPIEVEMFLDGSAESRFIYWISDKVLHTGAPTDPIDFTPSAP